MFTRLFAVIRSLIYASGFVLLWWWVIALVRPLDTRIHVSIPEWLRLPGIVIAVIGVSIGLWCIAAFALIGKGTPAPFDAPREFVAVGPYKYVRNPMYIGAVAIIIGTGLIMRSPSALAVSVFVLALTHIFVMIYEEPTLEKRFGSSYMRYKKAVNRWLPHI